jgi:hypothetical protein
VDVFVSRLHPDTGIDTISECVKDMLCCNDVNDLSIECVKLQSKYADLYSSFYVSVSVETSTFSRSIGVLMSPDSWPAGILVRRYFKPKNG